MRRNLYRIFTTIIYQVVWLLVGAWNMFKTQDFYILKGDLYGLAAMPLYASSYIFNARACKVLPSMIVFHCFGFIQMSIYITYYVVFTDVSWTLLLSRDITYGFFGWLTPEYFVLSAVIISFFLGIFGVGSYIFLLDYFSPSVVASLFLLQPFVGQILGVLFGQDGMPGGFAYFGASIITIGLCLIIKGNTLKDKEDVELEIAQDVEMTDKSLLANDPEKDILT